MPAVLLTPLEVKLLQLVLDQNAAEGEIATGSLKLVQSLRSRGVEAAQIAKALSKELAPTKQLKPDVGLTRFLWGPNKGKPLIDISPRDLRNAVGWARRTPGVAEKFADFIHDVEQFLQQG